MAPIHVEAPPLSAHEAHPGVRQPQEWRQPGQRAVKKRHSDILLYDRTTTQGLLQTFIVFTLNLEKSSLVSAS